MLFACDLVMTVGSDDVVLVISLSETQVSL